MPKLFLKKTRSFTLLEIVVVITILGILSTLAATSYLASRERTLDNEALSALSIIQAAEVITNLEQGSFWPNGGGADANTASLRANLRIDIVDRIWIYEARTGNGANNGTLPLDIRATRRNAPPSMARKYYIDEAMENACCWGAGCDSRHLCAGAPPY